MKRITNKTVRKVLRRIGGTLAFLVGTLFLLIPLIPGWPLIGVGLYLLSVDSPEFDDRVRALRKRFSLLDSILAPLDRFLGYEPRAESNEKLDGDSSLPDKDEMKSQ